MNKPNSGVVRHRAGSPWRRNIAPAVISVVAVSCASAVVSAADNRDYSGYATLAESEVSVVNKFPSEDKWNLPEAGIAGFYLVGSGCRLSSSTEAGSTSPSPDPEPWDVEELAIAGTFTVSAKYGRNKAAIVPNLALLPGGVILLKTAYGTINGDTLDIRGTAEEPAWIKYDFSTANDKVSYYALLGMAFTGDEDAVVGFRYTSAGENYDVFQRAFRVSGGFRDFMGTIMVEGENTWLRPQTTSETFDIGGTLWVTNGANVYIDTVSPTFGSLVLAPDATLRIAPGKSVTITNSLSVAEGAKIQVKLDSFVYDDGTGASMPVAPVLSVCGAARAAAVDRDALLAAIRIGEMFTDSWSFDIGSPRTYLIESPREDGGVDFKVSYAPVVLQLKSCVSSSGPYGTGMSAGTYADYLSDGKEIDPEEEKDYYNPGYNIFFGDYYVFPGRSMTVRFANGAAGTIGFYGGDDVTIHDMHIVGEAGSDSRIRQMSRNGSCRLEGSLTLHGTVNFRPSGSGVFHLGASLCGDGDLVETLDILKIEEKEQSWCGTLSLEGDNTAYSGRILVGCGKTAADETKEGFTNLTLTVSEGKNLGGARREFAFDAVKIAKACRLSVTDTATFDAANRGWCLMDGSSVDVASGKVATMKQCVTFGGTSEKTGEGTLVLGGRTKFHDSEKDVAVDTSNGAALRVAAGGFGVTSSDAMAGMNLEFADGARLVVLPESGCLVLESAPVIEGAALPVELEIPKGADSMTVDILSLPTSASFDSGKLSMPHLPGYEIVLAVRQKDGRTVYAVDCRRIGFIITVR